MIKLLLKVTDLFSLQLVLLPNLLFKLIIFKASVFKTEWFNQSRKIELYVFYKIYKL